MAAKRKISVRKILQVLVSLVMTTVCLFAIMSASHVENAKKLTGIDLNIKNSQYHFIDTQRIMNMIINDRHIDIKNIPVGKIDVHSMEKIVTANPWVADAELYIDNTHMLHINVTQRVPVARVFDAVGNSYYLDTTLNTMPLSKDYTYYTTVVTNVPDLKNDSLGRSVKAQIVSLVRFIEGDTFWNAQVSQIIMDTAYTFELIPVLGTHKIIFGDTAAMKDKFDNLFTFYGKVLDKVGWDKYQVLDLRFKGQVVASPSLPWNGPVDKVMSNMNWAKSIIESGEKDKTNTTDTFKRAVAILPKAEIRPAAKLQKQETIKKAETTVKKEPKRPVTAKPLAKKKSAEQDKKAASKKPAPGSGKSVKAGKTEEDKQKTAKYIYKQ